MKTAEYNKKMLRKHGVVPYFYNRVIMPLIKDIKGGKCEKCGSNKNIDVHHLDYDNLTIDNFKLLCRKCHKVIHPKIKST